MVEGVPEQNESMMHLTSADQAKVSFLWSRRFPHSKTKCYFDLLVENVIWTIELLEVDHMCYYR
jgi:hypothetical protein